MTRPTLVASGKAKVCASDLAGYTTLFEPLAAQHFKKVAGIDYGAIRLRLATPANYPSAVHLIAAHGRGWEIFFWAYTFQADPMLCGLQALPEDQAYLLLYHWYTGAVGRDRTIEPPAQLRRRTFKTFFTAPTPQSAVQRLIERESHLPTTWHSVPQVHHLLPVAIPSSFPEPAEACSDYRKQVRAENYADQLLASDADWPAGKPIIGYIDLGHCYLLFSRYTPHPAHIDGQTSGAILHQ